MFLKDSCPFSDINHSFWLKCQCLKLKLPPYIANWKPHSENKATTGNETDPQHCKLHHPGTAAWNSSQAALERMHFNMSLQQINLYLKAIFHKVLKMYFGAKDVAYLQMN